MGKVYKRLQSTMQIIIQKAPENFIFDPRNLPPVPSVNVTMATKNDVNTYIAAEMPFPLNNRSTIGNLSNQFVIGDGSRDGSYHNAPLHPGTLYIVYARIVTRSLTGDFVYGEAAILIFKTAISKLKAVSDNDGLLQIPKNLVIGVAVGVALFALIFVSCCLCTKSKRKRKSTRKRVATRGVQGYEMQTRTTDEPYQELIRHPQQQQQQQQQPLVEDGNIYMNSSCGNGHLYANDMAHSKLYRTDDVVYSNAAH